METYLSAEQVAGMIPGMTAAQLGKLRLSGKGPRYRKPTSKSVLYKESEVIEWIENSARTGTTEAVSA